MNASPRPDKLLELKEVHRLLDIVAKESTVFGEKQRNLISAWYGLGSEPPESFKQISDATGIPIKKVTAEFGNAMCALQVWRRLFVDYEHTAGSYGNMNEVF